MTATAWIALGVIIIAVALAWKFAPKGWRTIATNGVVAAFTVGVELIGAVQTALPDNWAVFGLVAVNLMNFALRRITTTPIGKSA